MTIQGKKQIPLTDLNRVRRFSDRARYEKSDIYEIIDQCLVAHVGFIDEGRPIVIPMACARDGDSLLIHGARKGRITDVMEGRQVCLTLTLVDALVYARSMFHSSMNYRSAMVFGLAHAIEDSIEVMQALNVLSEHMMPGRWNEVRSPLPKEVKATQIMRVSIERASAKVRDAGVLDDMDDYTPEQWSSTWAGVVPMAAGFDQPLVDPATPKSLATPVSVLRRRRHI